MVKSSQRGKKYCRSCEITRGIKLKLMLTVSQLETVGEKLESLTAQSTFEEIKSNFPFASHWMGLL